MRSLVTLVIISSLSLWTGCSDKQKRRDTTEPVAPATPTPEPKSIPHFTITDIDQRSTTVTIEASKLSVAKVTQPMILLNIFAAWSAPSCGMLPYLDALQKRYPKDLFVISLLVNSDLDNQALRRLMTKEHASYFISNTRENEALAAQLASFLKLGENYPVPLTILFKNGEYTTHYIGATPIEMIKADIEQLRSR